MMSARPPNAPTGRPPPMILPKHVKSGVMPKPLLRAAAGQPETRHHFVENQQRAVRLRDFAQKFQIARLAADTSPALPGTGSTMMPAI